MLKNEIKKNKRIKNNNYKKKKDLSLLESTRQIYELGFEIGITQYKEK